MTSSFLPNRTAVPPALKNLKRILLIRFSSIGDIILTEPVVRVLSQHYPDAKIDYVTKPQYKDIPTFFPYINNIITGDSTKEIINSVRQNKYDLVIDLHKKTRSMLVKISARSEVTNSYNKKRRLRCSIVKHKKQSIGSTVALYFSSLDFLKLGKLYDERTFDIDEKFYPQLILTKGLDTFIQDDMLKQLPKEVDKKTLNCLLSLDTTRKRKQIAIFPGALHPTKQYPPQQIARVINHLSESEVDVYLLGSSGEKELCDNVAKETDRKVYDWCGLFNLRQLITLMDCFDLIITNDSGPMHIAAALAKKQIAIFGATDPVLGFKPHNKRAIVISSDLPCRPCSLHGDHSCPQDHFNCMKKIDPDHILSNIRKLLKLS